MLLPLLGVDFDVIPADVEELTEGDPAELVVANAQRKATAVSERHAAAEAIVLGVDTDVVLDGRVLGKPDGPDAARRRLRALAGREHEVLGGVCLLGGGRIETGLERTTVRFRSLGEREIERYVETGEWRDRAGGYAVQGLGSALISAVDGELANVIGLPVALVSRLLDRLQKG